MSWNPQPYNPASQWGHNPPRPGPPASSSGPPGHQPYNPGNQAAPTQSLPPGQYFQGSPPPTSSLPPGGYSQARPQPYTVQSPPGYSQRPPPAASYGHPPPPTSSYSGGAYSYSQPPPQQSYGSQPPPPGMDPELWGWFQAVDTDRSGTITAIELRQALLNNNWSHFNAETCRLLIGMFDRNKDGTIDAQEFAALWKYVQEWKNCFDRFDRDKSGNIDCSELHQAFQSFGYRLSMEFCQMCTRLFDRSDVQTMKFDDFIQCCVMLRALTESFKKKDTNRSGIISVSYEQFLEMAIDNTM